MNEQLKQILEKQRKFFRDGNTLPDDSRLEKLRLLRDSIKRHEKDITDALHEDLGKSEFEGFMCEAGLVISEISFMIRNLRKLTADKTVSTPLTNFPASSFIRPGPRGNVLIVSPWNYPFLLAMDPLADAVAAGNTAIIKPSRMSPATVRIMGIIIKECFRPEHVFLVEEDISGARELLKEKFDFIFFTGSQNVGREVLRCAAENLTPAVLELGGKSPCIVDETADIKTAARRIVFGKFLNCGQTCVAPDYILCHRKVQEELQREICLQIEKQYGSSPLERSTYGKIISRKHFDRIRGLIDPEKVITGGQVNEQTLQIAPTVMTGVTWEDPVMQEEIFGPVLPVLAFDSISEVISMLAEKPKPLAFYFFSDDKSRQKEIMTVCRFGGGCVNDTIIHLATTEMPFGGFGESGMGSYHGEEGFKTFSHMKSIVNRKIWPDFPVRYAPYDNKFFLKLLHFLLK